MENKPFAVWQISENESVNLVLEAAQICELENKLGGRNLMSAIGNNDTGMPSLRTMMLVTHAALQRFNHGKQMSDVYSMYDRYIANGGSQVDFYAGVRFGGHRRCEGIAKICGLRRRKYRFPE